MNLIGSNIISITANYVNSCKEFFVSLMLFRTYIHTRQLNEKIK